MDIDESPDAEAHALRAVLPAMERLGERVVAHAAAEHSYITRTGELESSGYSNTDPATGRTTVGFRADYALWVEIGHFIRHDHTPRTTADHAPPGFVYGCHFLLNALLAEAGEIS